MLTSPQVQAVEEGGVGADGDSNEEAESELGISRAGANTILNQKWGERVSHDETTMILIYHVGIKTTLFYLITSNEREKIPGKTKCSNQSFRCVNIFPGCRPSTPIQELCLSQVLNRKHCFRLSLTDDILFLYVLWENFSLFYPWWFKSTFKSLNRVYI